MPVARRSLTTIGSPWQGKPVGGEADESSSSGEESENESESEAKEVEPSGSGSRARAEKKEPTPDERPPSTEPGRQQPLLPERRSLAAAQEAKADINEEDLLEELLGMPSEEEAARPSPSSSGPFFCFFVFFLFCLWGQQSL
jgi:hypothetical protein